MTAKKILIILAVAITAVAALHTGTAHAALFDGSTGQACQGVGVGSNGCSGGASTINNLLTVGLNVLSVIIGIAAVVMMFVGGFKIVSSGGDANKVASGRGAITYAIIGLVVVAFAQSLVIFVLNSATKTPQNNPTKKTGIIRLVHY
ncbi:MAG TPA: hypothetical protein VKQ34_04940 [Candidatus Saccharimonadales bacterium]|nr:hypothetical protein [Candidatus Saccharimonadales bacterium]